MWFSSQNCVEYMYTIQRGRPHKEEWWSSQHKRRAEQATGTNGHTTSSQQQHAPVILNQSIGLRTGLECDLAPNLLALEAKAEDAASRGLASPSSPSSHHSSSGPHCTPSQSFHSSTSSSGSSATFTLTFLRAAGCVSCVRECVCWWGVILTCARQCVFHMQ